MVCYIRSKLAVFVCVVGVGVHKARSDFVEAESVYDYLVFVLTRQMFQDNSGNACVKLKLPRIWAQFILWSWSWIFCE